MCCAAGCRASISMRLAEGEKCRGRGQSPSEVMIDDLRLMIAPSSDGLGGVSFVVLRGPFGSTQSRHCVSAGGIWVPLWFTCLLRVPASPREAAQGGSEERRDGRVVPHTLGHTAHDREWAIRDPSRKRSVGGTGPWRGTLDTCEGRG